MSPKRRRVERLPEALANQIAAGEVVARPASAVKELLENAIDAGATRIEVHVDRGGIERIEVVDDGSGMAEDDARLALERHATSKLRAVEDLEQLSTLGFRGEALPSIASVSRFRLRTRPHDALEGVALQVDGGSPPSVRPAGGAPGTAVEVRDLFYNVPARRKFLRAVATEAAHVSEAVRHTALAHPSVAFQLIRDGRAARAWRRVNDRGERSADILDGYALIDVVAERGPLHIEAYLSRPERARQGAGGLTLFVNDRPIQDRALARAVAASYGEALERGRYPVGAVFLSIDPHLVDVNVHPQKAEVRFAHARAVTDALHGALVAALPRALGIAPGRKSAASPVVRAPAEAAAEAWVFRGGGTLPADTPESARVPAPPSAPRPPAATTPSARHDHHDPRLLGVARGRYVLWEDADELLVVDGRRALARFLVARLGAGDGGSQRLLFPELVELPPRGCDALVESSAPGRFGFELRRTAPGAIAVHAVPRALSRAAPRTLVTALAEGLADGAAEATVLDTLVGLDLARRSTLTADDVRAALAAGVSDAVVERLSWRELDRRAGDDR